MKGRLLPFRSRGVPTSVYLETSFISYLAARPSRDLVTRSRQEITRQWWEMDRHQYALYISAEVEDEIRAGDPAAAQARLSYVASLPKLQHIANPVIQRQLGRLIKRFGYDLPTMVTPEDVLLGG